MKDKLKTVDNCDQLAIGDVLYRRKGPVMHVGIYLGEASILHNTPKFGEHRVDFADFAKGKTVYAQSTDLSPEQILAKAQQVLDQPEAYRLFKRNCEHTANKVLDDDPDSHQLNEIMAWALIGGAFGKSIGKKSMYIGGFIGAVGGLLSLPRMSWIK
ncbi:MAG: C40 family peptidase [Algicola sp.]|nr:C40 family peptidase [Algicola sp.]